MDNNEAMEILIRHNGWRRGDIELTPYNSTQIGQAIDCAIRALGDGWIEVAERCPDPKEEPFLSSDGTHIWVSLLTESGNFIEQITGMLIHPTHYKLIEPPKPKKP